eukprot:1542254-Pleurochrysis_carterae.AAC.2
MFTARPCRSAVETCDEIEAISHGVPIVDGRSARQFERQKRWIVWFHYYFILDDQPTRAHTDCVPSLNRATENAPERATTAYAHASTTPPTAPFNVRKPDPHAPTAQKTTNTNYQHWFALLVWMVLCEAAYSSRPSRAGMTSTCLAMLFLSAAALMRYTTRGSTGPTVNEDKHSNCET